MRSGGVVSTKLNSTVDLCVLVLLKITQINPPRHGGEIKQPSRLGDGNHKKGRGESLLCLPKL